MRIDNNFCYFLKYLCSPEKGCFSCVVLKRAVFCKRCYCCLMPVIFAWNSGCWSFSAKYLSDLCRDLSGKTCFNFGCWFPDLSVSQTSIFFRILYYFCHSKTASLSSQLVIRILLLLPLWQNLMTFRSMIVFLFYRCVLCVKHLNLQLNRVFSFT